MNRTHIDPNNTQRWLKFLSDNYAVPTERWTDAPDQFLKEARTSIENGLPAKIVQDPGGRYYVLGKYQHEDKIHIICMQTFV